MNACFVVDSTIIIIIDSVCIRRKTQPIYNNLVLFEWRIFLRFVQMAIVRMWMWNVKKSTEKEKKSRRWSFMLYLTLVVVVLGAWWWWWWSTINAIPSSSMNIMMIIIKIDDNDIHSDLIIMIWFWLSTFVVGEGNCQKKLIEITRKGMNETNKWMKRIECCLNNIMIPLNYYLIL